MLFKIAGAQPRKLGGVDEWTISSEAIGQYIFHIHITPADDLLGGSTEPIQLSVPQYQHVQCRDAYRKCDPAVGSPDVRSPTA